METLRARGLRIGELETGGTNSIADVAGVRVGHVTIVRDDPVARTGVTAIVPPRLPAAAGTAVLNGAGELTGSLQIREWGVLETPVYLTATMAVGRVYDGAVAAAIAADPSVGVDDVVIPVVGECDDSWLSDPRPVHVEAADVARALEVAGPVVQGAVGAGTGMVCFDFKGGIGSSSRVVSSGAVVGALVLANFGSTRDLRIDGVPVGRELAASDARGPAGSCIVVLATDATLDAAGLERLARRAGLGLARCGSVAHHGSGEIFLAFSTATAPAAPFDDLFSATVDATEEAVVNALWSAETTTGREGRVVEALPHEPVLELLARAGALR